MKRIGFVAPWYGEHIGGGAEAELRGLVHHLKDAGMDLEVLTTCVECFQSDWSLDYHAPGLTEEAGIPVRRFRVRQRDRERFDAVNLRLMKGGRLSASGEETFCREMVNSPGLYEYIREHGDEYSLFVFIPYMFGTTYNGCLIHPGKSVLIPCLHDESYAYMKCFREAFSRVRGMIFHAEPERKLAERLYGVRGDAFPVLGEGVDTGWSADGTLFRETTGIRSPFILYAGRKDAGKRTDVLIRYFTYYRKHRNTDLKLVLIGGGKIGNPDPKNILDLGFVDQQVKYSAYAAAEFFCNPSEMESFSLVVMESWLAGRPVLVNGRCPVTREFAREARGGLYYENYPEFAACADWLLANRETAGRMGRNGREYVLSRFSWETIVREYTAYFRRMSGEQREGGE